MAISAAFASVAAAEARAQVLSAACPLAVRMSLARPTGRCAAAARPLPVAPSWPTDDGPVSVLPLNLRADVRSAYPMDRDNGALWSGRGASGSLSWGIQAAWGPFRAAVQPLLHASENRVFPLPDTAAVGRGRGAYPWAYGQLDWYLRPGTGRAWGIDPGDSFVEVETPFVRAGVSHERLRWGPARRYPLLFGGTAGGFPHAYVETSQDLVTYLGTFGGQVLWGRLEESEHFDADPRNDFRLLSALQVRWEPELVPGLEFSYALARHEPLPRRSIRAGQLVQIVTGDPPDEAPDRRGMAMGTLSGRLVLPGQGVELYGQVGRGEGFLNPQPDVSDNGLARIYLVGLSRTAGSDEGPRWRITAEAATQAMELPQPRNVPAPAVADAPPGHGHTHRGQLLGAWIGPGSNAQYLAFDRLDDAWTWGVFGERVRRDDDTYFRSLAVNYGFRGHDIEWTLGVRGGGWMDLPAVERITGPLAFGAEAGVSRRKNRNFTGLRNENWIFVREWNVWADLYMEWNPRLRP
ncbi:MAG: hypothetical protein RJQ04_03545 [Longimicrobiales bacterium]